MRILSAAIAASAVLAFAPATSFAEPVPVDYVRICDENGTTGEIYVPGTEDCENVHEGTALALALPTATIDPGKTYGINAGVGFYGGASAIGIGGAVKAGDGFTINGAVGVTMQNQTFGGNLGANFSW